LAEAQLAAVEKKCDAADKVACIQLATYHTKTMAQAIRALTDEAGIACRDGHKPSCEVLAANKRDIRASMDECKAGSQPQCELLSRMAQ
jgi:hypothetical protein